MVEIEEVVDDSKVSRTSHSDKNTPSSQPQRKLTTLQEEGLRRLCDGCGEGPRDAVTDSISSASEKVPLKRCSVCHEAWYHDRKCQQKHFPRHKKDCQRLRKQRQQSTKETTSSQQTKQRQHPLCCVQTTPDKGRSLVTKQRLKYGTVLGPNGNNCLDDKNKNNHWQPIVAPVLLENHRRYRCVVCFGLVNNDTATATPFLSSKSQQRQLDDYYPTRLCSDACRRTAASFLPSEQQAIAHLLFPVQNSSAAAAGRPPMILPTALLLYRLILAMERDTTTGRLKGQLKQLQSEKTNCEKGIDTNIGCSGQEEENMAANETAHQQAVCATTWAMMKAGSAMPIWHLDDVQALLQQVKLNGFSVSTGESVALGIGIYTSNATAVPDVESNNDVNEESIEVAPHWINHDCRPNLLQTFDYGLAGTYPSLRLTVCVAEIKAQTELTISYIDHAMPRHLRQQRLTHDYGFQCQCPRCCDNDEREFNDKHAIGYLCCPGASNKKDGCRGRIVFHGPRVGLCDTCGKPNNMTSLPQPAQSGATRLLQQLWDMIHSVGDSKNDDVNNIAALEMAYQAIKNTCAVESWYVREMGERLLQALLDRLGEALNNPPQQYSIATRAFELTEELVLPGVNTMTTLATTSSSSVKTTSMEPPQQDSLVLRRILLLYKSIKLRLFLNIRPQQAMQELHQVISPTCATFFPSHHEMMQQIRQDC